MASPPGQRCSFTKRGLTKAALCLKYRLAVYAQAASGIYGETDILKDGGEAYVGPFLRMDAGSILRAFVHLCKRRGKA